MSKEAMKLACKTLRDCHYYMINAGLPNQSLLNEAFTAYMELEAALALVNEVDQKQPAPATELREQAPVGSLSVRYFRGCKSMTNTDFDYYGDLPEGDYELYTPPPAQRKPLTSQERDAQRWRFLMENSYDSESVTQFHVWEHSWEPHSKTGEPTEWKQRVRGIALIDFIDRAIEAKLKEKNT